METAINWLEFLSMMPFMIVGFLAFIIFQLAAAHQKQGKDFKWAIFYQRNLWPWIAGITVNILVCYFIVRGLDIGIEYQWDVAAIFLGVSGGALGKGILRAFMPKK